MVTIQKYLVGIQPRTEELISGTRDWDRKRITDEELEELRMAAAARDFSIQVQGGYTYISDPMFYWQDLIRPFIDALEGLDSGPQLTRWFDNNTFYRKPIINAYPSISHRKLVKYYFERTWEFGRRAKLVIPSPYALYMASDDRYFPDKRSGVFSFAQEMERVALSLEEKGVGQIEFVEPFLFFRKPAQEDIEMAIDAFNLTTQRLKCEVMLHFPFGNLEGHFRELIDFNASVIGIDFFSTALSSVTDFDTKKGIAVGCIDARNSLLEGVDWVVNFVRSVIDRLGDIKQVAVIPNADLEFLPRFTAEEKMKVISEAARRLENAS
jgi:5-methyltetrahydropteroyltriglutamate--homocysteine methyltransferase